MKLKVNTKAQKKQEKQPDNKPENKSENSAEKKSAVKRKGKKAAVKEAGRKEPEKPEKRKPKKQKPEKEKAEKERNGKKKPAERRESFRRENFSLAALSVLAALLVGFFFNLQIGNYDEGVLEIYARQQDSFVRLVLDQINLLGDRSTEGIISDILGTLDNSGGRFWTLSKNEAMVFVKDVAETNSYRGFNESEYYSSDSAAQFLRGLSENRVTHSRVELRGTVYVCSGTLFRYNRDSYAICLMTNREVILDDNLYLNAKINLWVMLLLLLALFLLVNIGATLRLDKLWRKRDATEAENRELRRLAERLNARLEKKELYDTSLSVFDRSLMDSLLKKLFDRSVYPFTIAEVSFRSARERKLFLQASQLTMRNDVVRFSEGGNTLYIVGVRQTGSALQEKMEAVFPKGMTVNKLTDIEKYEDRGLLKDYLPEMDEV